MAEQQQHEVYETGGENEGRGYACRRCSLWARVRAVFEMLSCPPPGGR